MVADRFEEFEYNNEGLAILWHVGGEGSQIIIDPRVSFGAPIINGIPTWVIKGRWLAGETPKEIEEDFRRIGGEHIRQALAFEGIDEVRLPTAA